ncbi:MAG: Lrp/AsnC family transcriptional regulator [Nanoarchaeota archaeon]|nr:Lrp/AsnC family transcriptional regulator [Nanoarchaeota archaeon]MBU1644197.1 Lrp/AsnC family transcriptional regulator [Nanoarchaeota archaeon]MBU1976744.1 Lrp/AsnC family transcriptional regulator [Nanoarchaeota archaeon]
MNEKTIQLISCLRENSREKLTSISKKTNIPISTLFDLLKELKEEMITKNTVLINFSRLGYNVRAQILVKVNDKEGIKKHFLCNPNVNNVYKINNGWDFMIEVIHKNIKLLDDFIEGLNEKFFLEKYEVHYLVDEVKREGFLFS